MDFLGELKVSALLGTLEQAAVEASADGGFDPARYSADGRVWIVRRTRLERRAPLGGGDDIEIATHVEDFRRARSIRRYDVGRGPGHAGADAATATTDWVYCDVATGRPVSVSDEMKRALFGTTEVAPRARASRVEPPPHPPHGELELEVRPSHLDHMEHVNNAVWADFLEDAAFALFASRGRALGAMLEEGGALRLRTLDLEYLGDARLGDVLRVDTWLTEGDLATAPVLVQTARTQDGTRLLRAASTWTWRRRPTVLGGVPDE